MHDRLAKIKSTNRSLSKIIDIKYRNMIEINETLIIGKMTSLKYVFKSISIFGKTI